MVCPRAIPVALLVILLSFTGCIDDDKAPTPTDPPPAAGPDADPPKPDAAPTALEAPTWSLRDWWVYEDAEGVEHTFVVTGGTTTDWTIETDSSFYAFLDKAFGGTSTLGPQRKADLAGSQGSDRVVFYKWPLTDGDTWTTTWDGIERTIVATQTDDGFAFTATDPEGHVAVEYTYDPQAEWFGRFDFFAPDGGLLFSNTLVSYGAGWTGEVVRMELEPVLHHGSGQAVAPNHLDAFTAEFDVGPDHTDVFLATAAACASGVYHLKIKPTDPTAATDVGMEHTMTCPLEGGLFSTLGHAAGTWRAELVTASPDTTQYSFLLWLRTIETVPIG